MDGISSTTESRYSLLTMRADIGLKDSNCFKDLTYALVPFSNGLLKVSYYITMHSSIVSKILSATLI
jgi:hypothetical protein